VHTVVIGEIDVAAQVRPRRHCSVVLHTRPSPIAMLHLFATQMHDDDELSQVAHSTSLLQSLPMPMLTVDCVVMVGETVCVDETVCTDVATDAVVAGDVAGGVDVDACVVDDVVLTTVVADVVTATVELVAVALVITGAVVLVVAAGVGGGVGAR